MLGGRKTRFKKKEEAGRHSSLPGRVVNFVEVSMWKPAIVAALLTLVPTVQAQTTDVPIQFDGQIRVRSESEAKDFNSDTDRNSFSLLRARLGALARPDENVSVYFQVQDSRRFGTEPNTLASTANIDLHQAYFEVRNPDKAIKLKLGRQEIAYGGQRLIGPVGWHNVGRSFDGMKLTLGNKSTLDIIGAVITESGAGASDKSLTGLYYQRRDDTKNKHDLYLLYESDQKRSPLGDKLLNRATVGSYVSRSLSKSLNLESEAALQLGKLSGADVLAFMVTGSVGYTFQTPGKPSILIGLDYLSGTDPKDTSGDYKAFDTLFGTNHKFYGFMDYFINIPVHTRGLGLRDLMVKGKLSINAKLSLNAHLHNFATVQGGEKALGNELDFILNYKCNKVTSFVFGLAAFAPGDLMKTWRGSEDTSIWSFTSLLVNF
jgi:hypothetical protein